MENIRKYNFDTTIFFYIGLVIELIIVIIDKSAYINPIEGRLFQVTFIAFAIKMFFTKYSVKEWILIVFMCLIGIISYFITERNEIIRIVMFIAAAKDVQLKNIMKCTFYITLAGVLGLMLLSILGLLGDIILKTDYGRGAIESRYCLGLGHPNALHCMIWLLVLLGIYLYFDKMRFDFFVLLFVGNIFLYILTKSKTGLIIVVFTIIVAGMLKRFEILKNNKWLYRSGIIIFMLAILFSLATSQWGYSEGPFGWMDQYLTGRIRFSHIVGGTFAWSLFSNPYNTEYFDMGFMRLFYWYGIIPGTLYIITNLLQIRFYYKKKDSLAFLVVIAITIYTVVEAHVISVYIARNYILLLLAGSWNDIFCVRGIKDYFIWQLPMRIKGDVFKRFIKRDGNI